MRDERARWAARCLVACLRLWFEFSNLCETPRGQTVKLPYSEYNNRNFRKKMYRIVRRWQHCTEMYSPAWNLSKRPGTGTATLSTSQPSNRLPASHLQPAIWISNQSTNQTTRLPTPALPKLLQPANHRTLVEPSTLWYLLQVDTASMTLRSLATVLATAAAAALLSCDGTSHSAMAAAATAGGKAATPAKLRSAGDSAFMDKNYEQALHLYSQAILQEPKNEKNYYKRFRVFDRLKRTRNALSDLNHAIEINPEYTTAFALRARLQMTLGRCPGAAADYEEVLKIKPTHGDAKKMLPKARECAAEVAAAERLIEEQRWEEAERMLDQVMVTTGNAPHLKMLRGKARFMLGKYFEAIADAGDVLKIEKESVEALLLRGRAYYYTADKEMTMRHLREAVKSDPEHKETKAFYKQVKKLYKLFDRAETDLGQHNHQALVSALEGYRAALLIDPSNVEMAKTLYLRVCKCESKLGNKELAIQACESALAIDNTLLEGYLLPAEMIMKKAEESAEFEEAIRFLQRANEVEERNQKIHELLQRAEAGLKQSKQKNYYKILEIKRSATSGEVKKAYRKLAKKYHPDMHAEKSKEDQDETSAQFQLVAEAYEVLSDPEKKGKYDRGEEVFENQGNGGGGGGRHPFGGGRRGHFHGFHGF
jgi:DnaJ family protein C protein 3